LRYCNEGTELFWHGSSGVTKEGDPRTIRKALLFDAYGVS
jgi:hypothetical protein